MTKSETSEGPGTPGVEPCAEPLHRRALIGAIVGAAGAAALAGLAKAGPLDPPAGPVASTGKTLTEVEPRIAINAANTPGDASAVFIISQPGSYYLTGSVSVPAGKVGIAIAASDVTVDLNGFSLSGGGTAGSGGISDFGTEQKNITVRNGEIEGMGGIGLFLLGNPCRLLDLAIKGNGGFGVLTASRVWLERVIATDNAATAGPGVAGILVGSESAVVECIAASNTGVGINAGAYVLVARCTASRNTGSGITVGPTAVVVGCESWANGAAGITTQHSGVVEGCIATSNTGVGVSASFGSVVRNCSVSTNLAGGVAVWEGSVVAGCAANNNTGDGFTISTGCVVSACLATFNHGLGINAAAAPGGSVSRCVTSGNFGSGIVASARCTIRENNCEADGTSGPNNAGILLTGASNRVEGNLCGAGKFGVWVNASRNMIVRNACRLNLTNWSIAANCIYGPVIDRTVPNSSAMSGNGTVSSTLGSADANANFSY